MASISGLNTPLADINEILLGYYMLGGKWTGFIGRADAQKQLKQRQKKVGEELYAIQSSRAKVMADDSIKWAKSNGYNSKVKKVWWTARPGVLTKAVGYEVDSKKNPTDTLIEFEDGQFLGLSAKSTAGKGDIGFKNPGVGTIDNALKINLAYVGKKEEDKFASNYDLPDSKSARKTAIRKSKSIDDASNKARDDTLKKIRDIFYKKINSISVPSLRKYLMNDWMDVRPAPPAYIKVTGHGNSPPYTSSILDPLKNTKSAAIQKMKIKLEKVGNDSVGVTAGGMRIMKMRVKYESQAMASSIKFSGDPWK